MTMTAPLLNYHSQLVQKDKLAQTVWRLRFARPVPRSPGIRDWDFAAGQYAHITALDMPARAYSIASGPQQDHVDLHIRDTGHGLSYALTHAAIGTDVHFSGAEGAGLPASALTRPLILVAGGVGFAPIASLLDSTGLTATPRLYWGTDTPGDLYMHDALTAAAASGLLSYQPCVMTGHGPWRQGPVGPAITADVPDLSGYSIYLSGPSAMVVATVPLLLRHGAEKAYIFGDGIGL